MFDLLRYQPMSLGAMLRHNLVHIRDMAIGEYIAFVVFSAAFIGLWLWLRSRGSYRFRIRPDLGRPRQMGREFFNASRAVLIYNAIQIVMRIFVLGFGFVLTFDHPIPFWEAAISYPLVIVVHDAYFYWTHRLMHLPGVFRLTHWEHHRSKEPTVFTAYSFSISESVVQGAYPIFFVLLFPCTFGTLIFFYFVAILHDVVIHSGVDVFPKWLITSKRFGWICGTLHHDMHHQVGRMNYGLYTRFWDRLMKTEHPDFERVFDYVHSPQNDGRAYKLLSRSAKAARLAAEPEPAAENAISPVS